MLKTAINFKIFLVGIYKERRVLWGLARNDLKARFASSVLGGAWAYIQPLVTLLVMWFVFQAGFKNPPVSGVPFIVWLAPAYLAWSFVSDALLSGTNCLMEYSYLVKKVNFRVSMLPLVKILSALFVHLGFIVFILILMLCNHVPLSIHNVQIIYFLFCEVILLTGQCWFTSALAPFIKDVANLVNVILQIGFWATPIFWSPENMSPLVQNILKLNPMYYICRGYRQTFITHIWFWQEGYTFFYFWAITLLFFVGGAMLFHKLRPQFADVL